MIEPLNSRNMWVEEADKKREPFEEFTQLLSD